MDNETKRESYKEAGKYCLDLSKLVLGGVIIAGIMRFDVDNTPLFLFGGLAVFLSAFVGFLFIRLSNLKK